MLTDIIKQEHTNREQIFLYRESKFFAAYEVSAYLLTKYYWPNLKVTVREIITANKNRQEILRVGFIDSSLAKVLSQVAPTQIHQQQTADQIEAVTIDQLSYDQTEYQLWREKWQSLRVQAEQQLAPFYGALPVYKKTYDVMSLILTTVRAFPRDLRDSLGNAILAEMMAINEQFRRFCAAKIKRRGETITGLDELAAIQQSLNTVMFLLRLAFDQKAYGLERSVAITEQLETIKRQLDAWEHKLRTKKKGNSAPLFPLPLSLTDC